MPDRVVLVEALNPRMGTEFRELFAIYQAALPQSERKSEPALRAMLERPDYRFRIATLDRAVVGFSIVVGFSQAPASLLEYMAVAENCRGKGIGEQLFRNAASGADPGYLLMEIEAEAPGAPDADDRIRRRRFYKRLGCRQVKGLAYRMPPVTEQTPPAMGLFVARNPLSATVDRALLQLWLECLYTQVYGKSREDPRIGEMLSGLPQNIELI